MLGRLAGRLLTSPLAFALAGVIDFAAFGLAAVRARLSRVRMTSRPDERPTPRRPR